MTEGKPPALGFPELAEALLIWVPLGGERQAPGPQRAMRLGDGSWRSVIPCANPACRDGGHDVGFLVEGMVPAGEAEKRGVIVCSGWEGGIPSDPAAGIPCVWAIRYQVTLTYRKDAGAQARGAAGPAPPAGTGA